MNTRVLWRAIFCALCPRAGWIRGALQCGASKPRLCHSRVVVAALACVAYLQPASVRSEQARVAVAANFTATAQRIAQAFQSQTSHTVVLSFGSTGQLFAQISQAAPFDAYLAADQVHPQRAVDEGLAVPGSRFTYATGRIALYSADASLIKDASVLNGDSYSRLAIANPDTAPYGRAAMEFLRQHGGLRDLDRRLVKGASVAQTMQFVATGNAQLGVVALAQIYDHDDGSRWLIPDNLHSPIAQDAVLLTRGSENAAAIGFLEFLQSDVAQDIKSGFGYQASQ